MENKQPPKTVDIRFRVEPILKEKWLEVTNKKAVNGSEILRRFVMEYIEENK